MKLLNATATLLIVCSLDAWSPAHAQTMVYFCASCGAMTDVSLESHPCARCGKKMGSVSDRVSAGAETLKSWGYNVSTLNDLLLQFQGLLSTHGTYPWTSGEDRLLHVGQARLIDGYAVEFRSSTLWPDGDQQVDLETVALADLDPVTRVDVLNEWYVLKLPCRNGKNYVYSDTEYVESTGAVTPHVYGDGFRSECRVFFTTAEQAQAAGAIITEMVYLAWHARLPMGAAEASVGFPDLTPELEAQHAANNALIDAAVHPTSTNRMDKVVANVPNATPEKRELALFSAVYEGDVELIRTLLDTGIDQVREGGSAMHDVISGPHGVELLKMFVDHGWDVNHVPQYETPLVISIVDAESITEDRKLELLSVACSAPGVNVNAKSSCSSALGGTALHHNAVGQASVRIAQLLIEHGADVNALDCEGHTALYHALYYEPTGDQKALAKFLKSKGGKRR